MVLSTKHGQQTGEISELTFVLRFSYKVIEQVFETKEFIHQLIQLFYSQESVVYGILICISFGFLLKKKLILNWKS